MFILEGRVPNCCLHRYGGCRAEERLDLFCLAPEGRAGAGGADFGSG